MTSSVHTAPFVGRVASGTSEALPLLIQGLASRGHPAELHVLEARPGHGEAVSVHGTSWPLGFYGRSASMRKAVDEAATHADVVHAHMMWLLPTRYAASAALAAGKPLVFSPHGSLARPALQVKAPRKRLVWRLWQRRVAEGAQLIHATSEEEAADVRRAGLLAPIAVIPNAVRIPDEIAAQKRRDILFLGRLHPIKGVDRLIDAWARIASRHPGWRVRIVGPGENGYARTLHQMVDEGSVPSVSFESPVTGDEKDRLLAESALLVLPSRSENFGMSAAEALAAGTAVVASSSTPWSDLERAGCGWVFGDGADLAEVLDTAIADFDGVARRGAAGRVWATARFGSDRVADMMAAAYDWASGGGPAPDFVSVD